MSTLQSDVCYLLALFARFPTLFKGAHESHMTRVVSIDLKSQGRKVQGLHAIFFFFSFFFFLFFLLPFSTSSRTSWAKGGGGRVKEEGGNMTSKQNIPRFKNHMANSSLLST